MFFFTAKTARRNPYTLVLLKEKKSIKMLFLLVVVLFLLELVVVALAVAAWLISQPLEQHDFSIQSTENQKKPLEPFGGSLSNGKEEFLIPGGVHHDQLPCLNESVEPERAQKRARHTLRNSLEWDTAFLTSPGVLDPEELSCLINGAGQDEEQMLMGTQEDVWRFIDPDSTLESDSLILENLEAELFEDIRASIQKFSKKAFTAATETHDATSDAISSKRKMNISSQNQKQLPALKEPIGISKSLTNQAVRRQGTVRGVKQDAVDLRKEQPVDRYGDSNLTLPKPPQVISKGKCTPAKTSRTLIAANPANKIKHNKPTVCTVAGKRPHASKKPVVSGAREVRTKPASSSKASSFDSSTSTDFSACSSTDISGSVCSDKACKSHLATIQIRVGDRNVMTPSSNSTFRTPSKSSTRNMTTPGDAAVAAYLMSPEISSSISPDSSICKWSSSTSSSSTTSLDASSCRSLEHDIVISDFNDHDDSSQILNELDFLLENDDLVLEPFGGSPSNEREEGLIPCGNQDDRFSYLNKSLETGRSTRKGLCSLRKSLDWNSAFFTSDGLLDPEELSFLINGAEQSKKQIFRGTQDDFYNFRHASVARPGDSNLTLPNRPSVNNKENRILAKPVSSFNSTPTKSATSSLADSSGRLYLSSEWSPASSSSSCTTNLRCNNSGSSFNTNSCRYETITSDSNDYYSSQMLDNLENGRMDTPIRSVGKSSRHAFTLPCLATTSPSALRMPSPKFGFFDW